jgi:hypothetical protein
LKNIFFCKNREISVLSMKKKLLKKVNLVAMLKFNGMKFKPIFNDKMFNLIEWNCEKKTKLKKMKPTLENWKKPDPDICIQQSRLEHLHSTISSWTFAFNNLVLNICIQQSWGIFDCFEYRLQDIRLKLCIGYDNHGCPYP